MVRTAPRGTCVIQLTSLIGTIVSDSEMGEVIQLQGDQRKDVQDFLVDKDGLHLDAKTIKVRRWLALEVLARHILTGRV
jgi:hypothetical protein